MSKRSRKEDAVEVNNAEENEVAFVRGFKVPTRQQALNAVRAAKVQCETDLPKHYQNGDVNNTAQHTFVDTECVDVL